MREVLNIPSRLVRELNKSKDDNGKLALWFALQVKARYGDSIVKNFGVRRLMKDFGCSRYYAKRIVRIVERGHRFFAYMPLFGIVKVNNLTKPYTYYTTRMRKGKVVTRNGCAIRTPHYDSLKMSIKEILSTKNHRELFKVLSVGLLNRAILHRETGRDKLNSKTGEDLNLFPERRELTTRKIANIMGRGVSSAWRDVKYCVKNGFIRKDLCEVHNFPTEDYKREYQEMMMDKGLVRMRFNVRRTTGAYSFVSLVRIPEYHLTGKSLQRVNVIPNHSRRNANAR